MKKEIHYIYYTNIKSQKANTLHFFQVLKYLNIYVKTLGILPKTTRSLKHQNENYTVELIKGLYFPYLIKKYKNKIIKYLLFEISRMSFYVNYLKYLSKEKKVPHKIITQDPSALAILSLIPSIKKRVIYYSHVFSLNILHRFCETIWLSTNKHEKTIIVISPGLKKIYKSRYDKSKLKIKLFSNGVEEIFFKKIKKTYARKKLKISKKFVVSYIGKFYTENMEKGIKEIIKYINKNNIENVTFYFVGATKHEKEEYEKIIENKESIKIIEHVPQNKARYYMYASDILIIPYPYYTHFKYFASPMKLFEYMATGIPILASDLYIHKYYLKNFANYYKAGNIKDFLDQITKIRKNYHDHKIKAEKGRRYAYKHYIWKEKIKKLVKEVIL